MADEKIEGSKEEQILMKKLREQRQKISKQECKHCEVKCNTDEARSQLLGTQWFLGRTG